MSANVPVVINGKLGLGPISYSESVDHRRYTVSNESKVKAGKHRRNTAPTMQRYPNYLPQLHAIRAATTKQVEEKRKLRKRLDIALEAEELELNRQVLEKVKRMAFPTLITQRREHKLFGLDIDKRTTNTVANLYNAPEVLSIFRAKPPILQQLQKSSYTENPLFQKLEWNKQLSGQQSSTNSAFKNLSTNTSEVEIESPGSGAARQPDINWIQYLEAKRRQRLEEIGLFY